MDHAARAKKALEGLIYSPRSGTGSAGEDANSGAAAAGAPADAALFSLLLEFQDAGDEGAPKARPWERGDLVRRLRSFRPATWFCKPAPAGPIECARRGWVNAGQDLLSCEFCKAKLALTLPVTLSREETDKATKTFVEQLASKHAGDCPWRTAACAPELAAFPALPAETVLDSVLFYDMQVRKEFAARCAALAALDRLPPIAPAALAAIAASHGSQLDTLLADGPQQAQPWAAASDRAAQQSPDPEPTAPAAPAPRAAGGSGPSEANSCMNGTNASPAASGHANGSGVAEATQGAASAGSPDSARRQRLLALLGWHAVPVPFGAVPTAGGSGGATAADAGSSPAATQSSEERLPAGQAVIFCRMCGAKHGLWSFLGAGGPDLSAARRPRLPASSFANGTPGSRGRGRTKPAQGTAATPASAPASLQAGGGAGANPVAWRGFGSPQQPGSVRTHSTVNGGVDGSSGASRAGVAQLLAATIAGGQLSGPTPRAGGTKGGPFGSKPFGVDATPSGGNANAGPPPAPFGAASKGVPVFGTPASAGRASQQRSPSAPAATIAGGTLTSAATAVKAAEASANGGDAEQLRQQQQQPSQPSSAASGSPSNPGSSAPPTNGSAHPADGAAQADAPISEAAQQPTASPFGSGATAAPVFGIAAMCSTSIGTPRGGATAAPKRSRDEASGAASEDVALPKRPKTSRGLPSSANEAAPAPEGAQAADSISKQPDGAGAAQQPTPEPASSPAAARAPAATVMPAAAVTPATTGTRAAAAAAPAQPTPLDPLKLHRPFCPWVQWHEAGGARRCGWSWCLDALVPKAVDASGGAGAADTEGQPRDRASLVMSLLKRVGVRR